MKTLLAALILGLASSNVYAWRCHGWIIDSGQSQFEIEQKCGAPQRSERRIEWRWQTTYQQQCQNISEPVVESAPVIQGGANGAQNVVSQPRVTYRNRTVCNTVPISVNVPVEVSVWYFDDNVPKALYFEGNRLITIEDLWALRH